MKTKNFFALCSLAFITLFPISRIHGQIVYSDIKDTTLYIANVPDVDTSNYYFFDLNNDNVMDFRFVATSYFDGSYHPPYTGKMLGLTPATFPSLNYIAGACWAFNDYTINVGDTISNNLSWDIVRYIKFTESHISWECTVPSGDIFLGLKLVVNSDSLYGWVRCAATDSSVTIKDYAYNAAPNTYILAGQTITGVDTDSLNYLLHIYTAYRALIVDFNGLQPQGTISIINLMGQVLQSIPVSGNHNEISLNTLNSGIYIVRVATPTIVYNKTIYLN